MANKSRYLEEAVINYFLRNTAVSRPATVYVALHRADPGKDGVGDEVPTSGTGYSRQPVTFDEPANGQTQSSADVVWSVAEEDWGTITHIALMTAATGGQRLYQGTLDSPKKIEAGDQFKIAKGNMKVIES